MKNLTDLHFEININAPVEKVYKTMLEKPTYEEWTASFMEGSTYEGEWAEGTKMKFLDPRGSGMYSQILEVRENEFVSISNLGEIKNGVIDTESESVNTWAPSLENYTFTGLGDKTKLEDLALLCANCHRVVHSSRRWLTVSQVKAAIKSVEVCIEKNV